MAMIARYCGSCGAKISGTQVQFCPECGESLQGASQDGDGLNLAQPVPENQNMMPDPMQQASAPWNYEPLVGFKPLHARMLTNAGDVGGDLSLVISGIVFQSGAGMERIPFQSITSVRMTRGMSTFGVTLSDGSLIEFKVYGAPNYSKTIQNILSNPNVAHQGGIKGTPEQIRAKGGGLIAVGVICLVLVTLFFRIFNPLYAGGMFIISIITIINGGKYLAAAKKAEGMQ